MFESERQIFRINNVRVRVGRDTDAGGGAFEITLWNPATSKENKKVMIGFEQAEQFATELAAAAAVIRASLVPA